MPAARLSATLRSSSANMYGGIASRRFEGSVRAMVPFVGAAAVGRSIAGYRGEAPSTLAWTNYEGAR